MSMFSMLSSLLKGKVLAAILVGVAVAGGATAVMAASPMGQNVIHAHPTTNTHSVTVATHPTTHPEQDKGQDQDQQDDKGAQKGQDDTNSNATSCPGLSDIQHLATEFGLSTVSTSNTIKAICALHNGTFKGTTTAGASVSSTRVFGLGEIEGLLALAKFTGQQNNGTKLADDNVQTLLANVLQHCGSNSLVACVKADIPNFHGTVSNDDSGHNKHGKY